jgi:sigma-E factor negative regulatory protein RseA
MINDAHRETDEQRQRLSEFQDGELDPAGAARLLEALAGDARLRATWERYHLIGHALRGEHCDPAHRAVAGRVRRALAGEPVRMTPRRAGRRARSQPWLGVALAASMAGVAVFVTSALVRDEATRPQAAQTLASRAPLPEQVGERWQLDRPDLASKLDRFLVTHQEMAPATGAKIGMLHYATFVGYDVPR